MNPGSFASLVRHAAAVTVLSYLSVNAAEAATYYVAPTGSDAASGLSLTSPFATVNKAVNKAVAGDTVLIRGGTYREEVNVTNGGGAEGNYVTVSAYGTEMPVMKGSDIVTGWVQHSGAIWKRTGWAVNSQQVFVDFDARPGKPLQQIGMPGKSYTTFEYNAAVGTGLSSMSAGSFFYDPAATTLYVWLPDGSDPNGHAMEVSTRRRIFYMAKPYIKVKGLSFRHTNLSAFAQQGAAVELSSNSIMDTCDIQWADFAGLSMGYQQNNAQVYNSNISNNGDSGINAAASSNFKVIGNKMLGNNYRNFNPLWHAGGLKAAAKSYGTVESNEVGGNKGSGVWFDYSNSGGQIIVRNNYIHDNGPKEAAIFMEVSTNGLIYNNVLVNNQRRGIYISGSSDMQVLNNTVVGTAGYAGVEVNGMPRDGATLTNNTIFNNIISGSTGLYDLLIAQANGTTIANNRSNYNNIYRAGQALKLTYGPTYATLAAWTTATGFDKNSISADSAFNGNGAAAAYSLNDGSPVIDMGADVSTVVTYDYLKGARPVGKGFDIGAFERPATVAPLATGTKDTLPPVVTISGLATSTIVNGSLAIDATATDNVGVILMNLYIDGVKQASTTANHISYVWDVSKVSGTHQIRVAAADAAQNTGSASASVTITQNSTAPTTTSPTTTAPAPTTTSSDVIAPLVAISSPTSATAGSTITISASATDNVAVTSMKVYVDGIVKATSSSGAVSMSLSTSGMRVGTHAIRVSASDDAQNTGTANSSLVIN